jgi:hypothetical protein
MHDLPFQNIWSWDFEFNGTWDFEHSQDNGELPIPVCMVARELRSRREIRLWQDQLRAGPPFSLGKDSLFLSFAADAELLCHHVLGWGFPAYVLDLRVEFLRAINTYPKHEYFGTGSLLQALIHYGLDSIGATEKSSWRDLILQNSSWSPTEQAGILNYCMTDVDAGERLFSAMLARGDIDLWYAINRGRYMKAVTRMETVGVPLDTERFIWLQANWDSILETLFQTLGASYGVHTADREFSEKLFFAYLARNGWSWPLLESGRPDTKDKTFKAMAEIHPELEGLRQFEYAKNKLKLRSLIVSKDGFNRCWLRPFNSRTSRNQPSSAKFIFGPAIWLREFLIRPKSGYGLAYIDWEAQEIGIAAGLSKDPALMEAYRSGDPHLTFGRQAQIILPNISEESCNDLRDRICKPFNLAINYGAGYRSLAERINQPDIAVRDLLRKHRNIYRAFWEWSDNRIYGASLRKGQKTVFGWTHQFLETPSRNSLRNFQMQSNGAEMMRIAACLGTESGIQICAPVHDAFLITAPLERLGEDTARMRAFMEEASRVVLDGFSLRTDEHSFVYPEHYTDSKKRGGEMLRIVRDLYGQRNL